MKPLSLLQALSEAPAKAPVVEAKAEELVTTQYLVYLIEQGDTIKRIGVPVKNVDAFDAHFESKPETLHNIDNLLEQFEALVLE